MRGPRLLLYLGLTVVGLFVLATLFAQALAPFDPTQATGRDRLQPPGGGNLMGTDQLRRDVFSRVVYGGRIPLLVAIASCGVSLSIGTALGWISGFIGRMSRTSMLDVLGKEYVTAARAKGLAERVVVGRHALRNALIPIVTVVGLQFALLMGGAILTETVYSWPGVARYLLESIENRDFPAIQGTIVFVALFISAANLAADVLYARLDPRVRF